MKSCLSFLLEAGAMLLMCGWLSFLAVSDALAVYYVSEAKWGCACMLYVLWRRIWYVVPEEVRAQGSRCTGCVSTTLWLYRVSVAAGLAAAYLTSTQDCQQWYKEEFPKLWLSVRIELWSSLALIVVPGVLIGTLIFLAHWQNSANSSLTDMHSLTRMVPGPISFFLSDSWVVSFSFLFLVSCSCVANNLVVTILAYVHVWQILCLPHVVL